MREDRDPRVREEAAPAIDDESFGALNIDLHENARFEGARFVGEIVEGNGLDLHGAARRRGDRAFLEGVRPEVYVIDV